MKHSFIGKSLLFAVTLGVWAPAMARCEFQFERIEQSNKTSALMFDVFNPDGLVKQFEVALRRIDQTPAPCGVQLKLKPDGMTRLMNSVGEGLDYLLAGTSEPMIYDPEADELRLNFSQVLYEELLIFEYQVQMSPAQFVAPGIYQDELLFEVTDLTNPERLYLQKKLAIATEVEPGARISFVGYLNRHQVVDFGELVDGVRITPEPQILIQSNGNFALKFTSEHEGALRHEGGNKRWDIPYQTQVGGKPVDLTAQGTTLQYHEATDDSGLRLPVSLLVPVIGERPAGHYEDIIRVTITPGEMMY